MHAIPNMENLFLSPSLSFNVHCHLTKPSSSFPVPFSSAKWPCRQFKCIVPNSMYNRDDDNISIPLLLIRPQSKFLKIQQDEAQTKGEEEEDEEQLKEKMFYLESIGVDSFRLVGENKQISTTSLQSIVSVVKLLQSMGIEKNNIGRLVGMCPEVLTLNHRDIRAVFTFLLREANVQIDDTERVIFRRPRLLACSVKEQLRPTLYFLQRLGIVRMDKYPFLLSCSVEDKFIPRLEFIQSLGLSYDDAVSMFVRYPLMFNYSIDNNLKLKYDYLVKDMGKNIGELKRFPQYFGYSLEKRIKPRHRFLLENDAELPLSVMLRASDKIFHKRVKNLQNGSLHTDDYNLLDPLYLYSKNF